MNNKNINKTLNKLFNDFAANRFVDEGTWPRRVNLVLAFADYVEQINKKQMRKFAPKGAKISLKALKRAADEGINRWLEDNAKTLLTGG
ncbi:MAG: hypothetical protein IJ529_00100 [Alphaproteobacteria bacterium]|nr:hypothetical protein [Alphaproteobacteria bacterium]MBQ9235108.1 hypothetical protein [Alphaproteobacteria bacterium]